MKITDIRLERVEKKLSPTFDAAWDPVPRESSSAVLVLVETDEGITGVGSGDEMIGFSRYTDLFIGEDPTRINHHVRALETLSFHASRYWPFEVALWDILGKAASLPVSRLFGGSKDHVPAYASFGSIRPPEERAESVLEARELGFKAVKLRIDPRRFDDGLAVVQAVREAVGDTVEIMVDINQAWRMAGDPTRSIHPAEAREIARKLGELDVFWLEEPLPLSDTSGLKSLRFAGAPRIAGGEMVRTTQEFLDLLAADALDVYQPDVVLSLGMSRCRTIAELALLSGRCFTPHTWTDGGIGLLANLHVTAGVGGGPYLEYPFDPPSWTPETRDYLLREPVKIDREGNVRIPNRPGLGIELNEEIEASLGSGDVILLD